MSLNTVLNTKFDIYRVLEELSKTNPLFNSELEFQFYLAWKIKELYKDIYTICLEYPLKNYQGKNRNIDLVLVCNNGNLIPIELKYKTSKFEYFFNNINYKLKDQSANDLSKYGHLKDVSRIEYFKETEKNFLVGYVITITNQAKTWEKILSPKQTDFEFSLENGSTACKGVKYWHICKSNHNKNNYLPINLKNDYFINWHDFKIFDKPNGAFKVLVTEVK